MDYVFAKTVCKVIIDCDFIFLAILNQDTLGSSKASWELDSITALSLWSKMEINPSASLGDEHLGCLKAHHGIDIIIKQKWSKHAALFKHPYMVEQHLISFSNDHLSLSERCCYKESK